jgi:hypothetical protein
MEQLRITYRVLNHRASWLPLANRYRFLTIRNTKYEVRDFLQ